MMMIQKKKILYIIAEMEDFWSSRAPLARAMHEKGYDIHVSAPGAAVNIKLKAAGYFGHNLPPMGRKFSPIPAVKTILEIRELLQRLKPDLSHTITLKYSFLTGLAARGNNDTKFIFTIAGLGYLFSGQSKKAKIMLAALKPLLKTALRHPQARITFQNPDDREILTVGGFVNPDSTALIYGSGVDLQKFFPAPALAEQPPIVLMATRLIKDKGVQVFIDMAEILKKRGVSARFQVAGGTTDHNPLALSKTEMEKMVASTSTEWLGKISDMPDLYSRSTLIVYPSWYREGIPRVLLEAAASGKAIVTTDHPGCREAVADNDNGILVPVRDAEAAANAVEELLKNSTLRKKMEKRGRERAEKEFDSRLVVAQTLKIYGL